MQQQTFECSFCFKKFNSISEWINHSMEELKAQPDCLICPRCLIGFENRFNLRIHLLQGHCFNMPDINNKLYCNCCCQIYSTKESFDNHQQIGNLIDSFLASRLPDANINNQ